MATAVSPFRLLFGALLTGLVLAGGDVSFLTRSSAKAAEAQPERNPQVAAFQVRDSNGDGFLDLGEFVAGGGNTAAMLRRDFHVFDFDGDGKMSRPEFAALPWLGPEEQRSPVPDPVVRLAEARWKELDGRWRDWDRDGDGLLGPAEFSTAHVARPIAGLDTTEFGDWDLNQDGHLSREEAKLVLDIAYGVRLPTGELLRLKCGRVIDWSLFRTLDPDGDGKVSRDEYSRAMRHVENWENWYQAIDRNNDGQFDFAEFAGSMHRTDPVATFLRLDTDLNGRLSPAELAALPVDQRSAAGRLFPGFDDDGDGVLSLAEFQLAPLFVVDVLAPWQFAKDANEDGKLSRQEFQFTKPPALAALTAEYFRRLDVNRDEFLTLDEWPFSTSHPEVKFRALDANADGHLTEAEFAAEGSLSPDRLRRDFRLFDGDADGRMRLTEFLTLPYWIPEAQRRPLYDPVMVLAESGCRKLEARWPEWDRDGDGALSPPEFLHAAVSRHIPGLEKTEFAAWDLNGDRKATPDEARRLVDVAFGIRLPSGHLLRLNSGRVVDWRLFRRLDPDGDGVVIREEYFRAMRGVENLEGWYQSIDANGDGQFDFAEFAASNHRTDPVGTFMSLDVDLDGRLTPAELGSLPADQPPLVRFLFPGFDADGDGALSLREFQLTPIPTLHVLASWQRARDANDDGILSPDEFRFAPEPVVGAALAAEYFRRLDVNEDQLLSPEEWPFDTKFQRPPFRTINAIGDAGPVWCAQFNSATLVFVDDAPIAVDREDADKLVADRARRAARLQSSRGSAEEFVYGRGVNSAAARTNLRQRLQQKLDVVDRLCDLTVEQKQKLVLAGRGDIERLINRAERLKTRLNGPGSLSDFAQFTQWITPLGEEAERLGIDFRSNIFGADSLMAKALPRVLTPEQAVKYANRRLLPLPSPN